MTFDTDVDNLPTDFTSTIPADTTRNRRTPVGSVDTLSGSYPMAGRLTNSV